MSFVNLGCAKNVVDSQFMAGTLISRGISLAPSPDEADFIVVNTCAFIEPARREAMETIKSVCNLKRHGNCRGVVVAGCLPQRYRETIARQLPDVDAFIGLDQLETVADLINNLASGATVAADIAPDARKIYDPPPRAVIFSGGPFAYLKIAEGCDHRCAFCAIPSIRGSYRSRTVASIVSEAEQLLSYGIRELNLVSQDTTSYGKDLHDGSSITTLLSALGKIGGDFWIRMLYGHPAHVTDRLLDTMASIPQICRYLDIPLQHSHPDVLRMMCRGNSTESVRILAERIRGRLPDVVIRTTFLVGFPGETEEHVAHMLRTVASVKFDHLGVFVYSPEEGTSALRMRNPVPAEVAEERRSRVLIAQREVVDARAASMIGAETEVLIESSDGQTACGRSRMQAPDVDGTITLPHVPASVRPGDLVKVKLTGQKDYDMVAELL